jgi:quercetin dioxygenase-like cupin family protein
MSVSAPKPVPYSVKAAELIVAGGQARLFTLAPGESIPWHHHSEITDHYFVLRGVLTVSTRGPDGERELDGGGRFQITPRTAHCLRNRGATDCQFLLLQGGGAYDWINADG